MPETIYVVDDSNLNLNIAKTFCKHKMGWYLR